MKQSLELKNLDLVKELLGLVFEYQNKGGGDAFFDVSGHTGTYGLRLCKGVWDKDGDHELYIIQHRIEDNDLLDKIEKVKKIISNIKPFEERMKDMEEKELSDKKEQLEKLAKELNVKIVG